MTHLLKGEARYFSFIEQIPPESQRQQADSDNQCRAQQHAEGLRQKFLEVVVDQRPGDGRHCIDLPPQHQRSAPYHDVPQHAAAHTGHYSDKHRQKGVVIAAVQRAVDPDDGEDSQSHRVEKIDGPHEADHLAVFHKVAVVVQHQEHQRGGHNRHRDIDGVGEHAWWGVAQNQVAQHTTAHRRRHRQHRDTKIVQPALNADQPSRNGKDHRSDYLQNENNNLQKAHHPSLQ